MVGTEERSLDILYNSTFSNVPGAEPPSMKNKYII